MLEATKETTYKMLILILRGVVVISLSGIFGPPGFSQYWISGPPPLPSVLYPSPLL